MTVSLPNDFPMFQYIKVPFSTLPTERIRRSVLSDAFQRPLDRVNVLGDDAQYGHQGCVNALTWADNGNLLLSGGDDKTVRLWRTDASLEDLNQDYPYVCRSVISTGHTANIFSVKMLPFSTRIVTAAGDGKVKVFDASTAVEVQDGLETAFSRQTCIRLLRCHEDRVKKIVTEDSPDFFLSLSEDGTVRQHDLRTEHSCRSQCPAPLLKMPIELSTISISPLKPYQFVVAGESEYGYLYDRRHIGRVLQEEWGAVATPRDDNVLTCVRRFGRTPEQAADASVRGLKPHITGSRISHTNGHEVLLTYSADKVYLFSTYDEPQSEESMKRLTKAILPPSHEGREGREAENVPWRSILRPGQDTDGENPMTADFDGGHSDEEEQDEDDQDEERTENTFMGELMGSLDRTQDDDDEYEQEEEAGEPEIYSGVPIVHPRAHFSGAKNRATVKDVNFLGPSDEYVVSGSDDGNWFMWDKSTGTMVGIYEGDSSVVNVIEGHPNLPVVAVSGIDNTVKLFSPTTGKSAFSRMANAERIIAENERLSRVPLIPSFASRIQALQFVEHAMERAADTGTIECHTQ